MPKGVVCPGAFSQGRGLQGGPFSPISPLPGRKVNMANLWAAQWYSKNHLDGERRHILYRDCLPALFRTRRECRAFIKDRYGYIKEREDLRRQPHGWRLPRAIKVKVVEGGEL